MQNLVKIGIIGKGAVGVNIAFNLRHSTNIETTLLIRDSYKLNQELSIKTVNGEQKAILCKQKYINQHSLAQLDLLILPVKQYQLEALLTLLSPIVNSNTTLLLLHNGMGGIELAQRYCPNNLLLAGITTDGVYKESLSTYIQTAVGKLEVGSIEYELSELSEPFAAIHPNLQWRDDIIFALYQKLAINAVINPLTALKNCKNGELLNYPNEVNKIKEEVFDLYEFMNLPIDNHALSQQIDDVIQLTKHNYSSMHQDLHNGRETEVEGILGFLVAKAEETGMKMDFVKGLYQQLKKA
ncbi:MAG: 2-dehydropantoate 2-reductase [Glaciecola sp.]|jgi:2-dehydropantoate 2-reductase